MTEANLAKYYLAKYFFIALSILQALAAILMLNEFSDTPKNRAAIIILFSLAFIFFSLHVLLAGKIKRVSISKKKLTVFTEQRRNVYTWDDVKDLKLLPFFNVYRLKIKGKRNLIYFLPVGNSTSLFGFLTGSDDFSKKIKGA